MVFDQIVLFTGSLEDGLGVRQDHNFEPHVQWCFIGPSHHQA